MAEAAPLIRAHSHARKAGQETALAHWSAAANEHTIAADQFKRTARTTSDSEALRILNLLEEEHRHLARIILAKDAELDAVANAGPGPDTTPQSARSKAVEHDGAAESAKTVSSRSSPATTTKRINAAVRESSPSLAREIASRRGIPQARSGLKTDPSSPETHRRSASTPQPRIPSSVMDSQSQLPPKEKVDDEGFTSFYNNLTTGTMSRLSSVLAFAGLPLTADEVKEESKPPKRRTVKANHEPDVKKIYSKAALKAIEEDHQQRGLQGQAFAPTESFYVVQPAGGTHTYASILAKVRADQHSEALGGDDEESFVDAREAQPPSPKYSRTGTDRRGFGNARTTEELELENATIKQTLEQLASRLANFEAHAQDASMAALTQSVANLRSTNLTADGKPQERIRMLEKQLEEQAERHGKLEDLARKQEKKIRAYSAKWEEIKKSAREKDKMKRGDTNEHDSGSPA